MTVAQTISHAGGTIHPDLVLGYQSSRESGNIIHTVPGRSNPDVTLRPARLRTGSLELFFADEYDAKAAEDAHANGSTFALVVEDRASVAMFYVVSGSISRELDSQTRKRWTVRVDYQEIAPE